MTPWYASKTLWLNSIAVLALILQTQIGFIIEPEAQTALLALINMALRLITKQSIDWGNPQAPGIGGPGSSEAGFINLRFLVELFLVCLIVAALAACATTNPATPTAKDTPLQTSGKSLLAVKAAVVGAAQTANTLCKLGTLKPDICIQAKSAYEMAKPAYDAAVDAYLLNAVHGGDPAALDAALLRVQGIANNMLLLTGGTK